MAVCLDSWFKQAKFFESHQRLDLQIAITDLAHREMADTEQQQLELTTEKESDSGPKALDLILGNSSDSSDPVQDEVENYFKQEQSPRDSSPLDWWKVNGHGLAKTGKEVPGHHSNIYTSRVCILCSWTCCVSPKG